VLVPATQVSAWLSSSQRVVRMDFLEVPLAMMRAGMSHLLDLLRVERRRGLVVGDVVRLRVAGGAGRLRTAA
jgi:hypothetical protein